MNHKFGVTWSVGYTKKATESFIAYYDPRLNTFKIKNWKRDKPVSIAHMNALKGLNKAEKENVIWVPDGQPKIVGNVLRVEATRKFDQEDTSSFLVFSNNEADFKLRTIKSWFVGFFDIGSNVGATSDLMKL